MPHSPTPPHAPAQAGFLNWLYFWLFDARHAEGYAARIEKTIGFLIVLSVCAVVVEHVPAIYTPHAADFHLFDVVTVSVFTVEYLLRWLTAGADPAFAGRPFARLRYTFSFYALIDLIAIAPFYVAQFVSLDVEALRVLRLLRLMRMLKFSRQLIPAWQEFKEINRHRPLRAKVYALLEPTGHSGQLHFYIDNFIMLWIVLSIVCVMLESVEWIGHLFASQFHWVDVIAFSIFTLEYVARLYSAPERPEFKKLSMPRWAHIWTWPALIDLSTILPFLLEHFLPYPLDLRFLRVFRLMRMLKLTRYTSATLTLLRVLQREWEVIFAALFVMVLLIMLTASMGYVLEHDAQPDKFENIPEAIYWAVVTLSTVGYGDISPVTPLGQALTVVMSLVGIGIFAIPAGLLASAFTDQLRLDREAFKTQIMDALADGEINPKEREEIIAEAERLHLTRKVYERMIDDARHEYDSKAAAVELQFGHLLLDAKAHPEFAAEQFRILIAQLELLRRAVGAHALEHRLAKIATPNGQEIAVLRLLDEKANKPPTGGLS